MNYYFMPRLAGLTGTVTLADFPAVDGFVPWPRDMMAHVAWTDGKAWQVRAVERIDSGRVRRFTEADLPADCPTAAAPFWFLHPEEQPGEMDALPTGNFMDTLPNWRGNIGLIGPTTAATYQGEYPAGMLHIMPGTLLSFATFSQVDEGVRTHFVLPNLHKDPAVREASVRFVGSRSRRLFKEIAVRSNHTSIVDISDIRPDAGELVVAVSKDITGIPLYLTHTEDFGQMSFEHTHPPSELVVFGGEQERRGYQAAMKRYWIEEAFA